MPSPSLYSRSCRLQGLLLDSERSVFDPAAFFTRPRPTSALLHLLGTPL